MTISNAPLRHDYDGNDVNAVFPYTSKIFASSDLKVILTDTSGVPTTLVETTDYSVSGVGLDGGGNVTLVEIPATGESVAILYTIALTQTTDLVNETSFFQDRIEDRFDRLCRADQVLAEKIGRQLVLPENEGGTPVELPALEDRKGRQFTWDATTGQPVASSPASAAVSTAMEPVVGSATLALARAAMGPWNDALVTASGSTTARNLQARFGEWVDVKDFEAKGDGLTDDTASIIAADAAATAAGCPVFFPPGTYEAYGVNMTATWFGDDASVTIIHNNNPTGAADGFVAVRNKNGGAVFGITFDGAASADPAWSSGTYDAFTGSICFIVDSCTDLAIHDCRFINSARGAGLRIVSSDRITVDNCYVERTRGQYGDGVYVNSSSYVRLRDCTVLDHTRIGVVFENGSYHCRISDCWISNGHDASILYGGTEYNAGCWAENSSGIVIRGCTIETETHYGLSLASGNATPLGDALYTVSATHIVGALVESIKVSRLGSTIISVVIDENCQTSGASRAVALSLADGDTVICEQSRLGYKFSAGSNDAAVAYTASASVVPATIAVRSCRISHTDYDSADVASTSSNSADISCVGGTPLCNLTIIRSYAEDALPISIKNRYGATGLNLTCSHLDMSVITAYLGSVSVDGSTVRSGSIVCPGRISFQHCSVETGTGYLQLYGAAAITATPLIRFSGCRFEKDISTYDYIIRLQWEGVTKPSSIFADCVFYNSGAATAVNSFIYAVRASSPLLYTGVLSDSTVTYLHKVNTTLGNPASGDTKATFH